MIIRNKKSLIALHTEQDRKAIIDEMINDGDVVKSIGEIDKKVEAQASTAAESVMELSAIIAMQAVIIEELRADIAKKGVK